MEAHSTIWEGELVVTRMTPSEAMVETIREEGVTAIPGVVGSAFMDALDLFAAAGIRFVPVRHEQTAGHMADAYARRSGSVGVCIGQNGPGVTNMVTSVAAAYLAHSPVVVVTPSATTASTGLDGFQEVDQLSIFRAITKFQVQVNRPDRMAEAFRTAFRHAYALRGPVQVDIPRDYFYGESDIEILAPHQYRISDRGGGDRRSIESATRLLRNAEFPVMVAGMGVTEADGVREAQELAEFLGSPVVTSYLHNDAFPGDHELSCGPIGYQGSKAAMNLISRADVILALGTRLSGFGTLPQYGIDYFPKEAKIVQIDVDFRQLGRVWPIEVGIIGDAREACMELISGLRENPPNTGGRDARRALVAEAKSEWVSEQMNASASDNTPISPRRALAELSSALPEDAAVTTDVGNISSVANAYLSFNQPRRFFAALSFGNCGFAYPAALGVKLADPRLSVVAVVGDGAWGMSLNEVMTAVEEDLPVTAVVFNNQQWGAEKRNQIDFYDDRFVGVDIGKKFGGFNFSEIARAMGANAIRVEEPGDLKSAYVEAFGSDKPTVVEIMVDPDELAEPFRRDALRLPERILDRYAHLSAGPVHASFD